MLITDEQPRTWRRLQSIVKEIFDGCGMPAKCEYKIPLPRGAVEVDVIATGSAAGQPFTIVCECKNWSTSVPQEKVHAFRTVMDETGANQGYLISRRGFQAGAYAAAKSTNITLLTFSEFQERYFAVWYEKMLWRVEQELKGLHTYYEMGIPGWNLTESDEERAEYNKVHKKHFGTGVIVSLLGPFSFQFTEKYVDLPFDTTKFDERGIAVPDWVRYTSSYKEFFEKIIEEGKVARRELRAVNPVTRNQSEDQIEDEDAT